MMFPPSAAILHLLLSLHSYTILCTDIFWVFLNFLGVGVVYFKVVNGFVASKHIREPFPVSINCLTLIWPELAFWGNWTTTPSDHAIWLALIWFCFVLQPFLSPVLLEHWFAGNIYVGDTCCFELTTMKCHNYRETLEKLFASGFTDIHPQWQPIQGSQFKPVTCDIPGCKVHFLSFCL